MGLSNEWGVSDGVLPALMVNIAIYVSLFRGAVIHFFHKLGFMQTCKMEAAPPGSLGLCRVKKFKAGDEKLKCIFCLLKAKEGEMIAALPCDHAFHRACLERWLQYHSLCPLCKLHIHQYTSAKSQELPRLSDELQTFI